ncbi:SDR family oxidoreductase [Rhodovarius crocodyli]|uniref:SDR family oxidoreductase n=1 Tax=Rhodovarius crocodyli TaxID=1979269 RepID=A0A437M3K0_9PROT|nr:SDR family oxidoreductase [Rhodovarius crocodyli]RVT92166.1 SDR family oxidoreductase [Rhodovarius crocodyli]
MELGIAGKTAIVCAASKGLGRGCAMALAKEGVKLVISARGAEALEATAAELRALGADVTTVQGDVTTEEGRAALLAACPNPDILVTNAGGPPPGDFASFTLDDWRRAVEANMLTPIALIQATVRGMVERGFGRIVNITSASVRAPIPSLELSNGARAGLTGAVSALARKVAAHNVTINNLLPGPFDTDRIRGNWTRAAETTGRSLEEVGRESIKHIPAKRLGRPDEFGATCAFLCSDKAGFITAQNILMDGGGYPGTM